ncbi:MAG: hypothetical protein LBT62_06800 [Deltaproteobacteria bacterium]|nr:hypothetical protein [Deltaproteobacteria bacterium]
MIFSDRAVDGQLFKRSTDAVDGRKSKESFSVTRSEKPCCRYEGSDGVSAPGRRDLRRSP